MSTAAFFSNLLFAALVWGLVAIQPASAYLDPSTGAFIFHCISAAILGTLITIRLWWTRLISFFRPKRKTDSQDILPEAK